MMATLAYTLFEGMVIYTLYLALEPYIRRRWPDTIISWTRAISGRFRDPLVGRDILFGCGLGLAVALLWQIGQLFPAWIGEVPRRPSWVALHALASNRFFFGELLDSLVHSIVPSMGLLTLLLFASLVFRRIWVAGLVVILLFAAIGMADFGYWFDVFGLLATLSVIMFTLVRLGLLSASVLFAVARLVDSFVITSDLSGWWATGTIVSMVFILALVGYGFYVALAGRPLFGSGWLEG
jgi:serine/threonine-protein kinase